MSRVAKKTEPCNVLEVLRDVLSAEKKYTFGEHTRSGAAIIEKVELHLLKHEKEAKKCPVISDGRHRAVALTIAEAFGAEGLEPAFLDISEDEYRKDSFESNVAHEYATKLSKIDKLKEVLGLIESGEATKEADIQKLGLTRYQAQEYWAKAMLVKQQDFEIEAAAGLKKEDARNAAKAADAEAYLAENAAEGKNQPKVVSGKVIRAMAKLMADGGVDEGNIVRRLVEALANGDELKTEEIIREVIKNK